MSESSGYDKSKDKQIGKFFSKTDKRYINVIAYSYDGGPKKIRISTASKNTNPNADKDKQWIQGKAISGITKEEAVGLINSLEQAVKLVD